MPELKIVHSSVCEKEMSVLNIKIMSCKLPTYTRGLYVKVQTLVSCS